MLGYSCFNDVSARDFQFADGQWQRGKSCDTHGPFGPFIANHHPEPARGGYVLAGHIHPAVRLSDRGGSFKLPCFWFSRKVGVLPAFGAFTGTAVVRPREGDQVYVIAEGEVLRVG